MRSVARFLDPLDVRLVGRCRWMTLAAMRYESDVFGGPLMVAAEFITDFASTPRFLPVTWFLTGNTAHRAAVLHDWLYVHPAWEDRALADRIFREAMGADDLAPEPSWRRALMWAGVRAGGWWAWRNHGKRGQQLNPIWSREGWPEQAP